MLQVYGSYGYFNYACLEPGQEALPSAFKQLIYPDLQKPQKATADVIAKWEARRLEKCFVLGVSSTES